MQYRHGSLEGIILSTFWELEKSNSKAFSVKDIADYLANKTSEKRAYTTVKTVMDRLFDKKVLYRYKKGKKFFYKSVYSQEEIVINSVNDIAKRYCCGNFDTLKNIINSYNTEKEVILEAV